MVFQDVYLMDDTIKRNIALSRPDAQFEEIVRSGKAVRCDELQKASAWRVIRQKLEKVELDLLRRDNAHLNCSRNFERCAYCCFDEATASVDPENEAEIVGCPHLILQEKRCLK